MKHPIIDHIQHLLRAHWWRAVYGVLGVLLFLQLVSWGSMLLDFNRIDRLILQASDLQDISAASENPSQPEPSTPKQPEKNIFKKEEVQYQLTAILMDYAVINGQNVKVGEKVGKAEILEINNDFVVIQEEDKDQPTTLGMFNTAGGGGNRGGRAERPPSGRKESPSGKASNGISQSERLPSGGSASAPMGGAVVSEEMITRFRNASPEERREMRAQLRQARNNANRQ